MAGSGAKPRTPRMDWGTSLSPKIGGIHSPDGLLSRSDDRYSGSDIRINLTPTALGSLNR